MAFSPRRSWAWFRVAIASLKDPSIQAKWIPKTIPTLILAGAEDRITPLKLFRNDKRFNQKNITFKSIKAAGHFPWIENPAEVAEAFNVYVNQLRK